MYPNEICVTYNWSQRYYIIFLKYSWNNRYSTHKVGFQKIIEKLNSLLLNADELNRSGIPVRVTPVLSQVDNACLLYTASMWYTLLTSARCYLMSCYFHFDVMVNKQFLIISIIKLYQTKHILTNRFTRIHILMCASYSLTICDHVNLKPCISWIYKQIWNKLLFGSCRIW